MKEIKVACQGADLLSIEDLKDFQGKLKKISKENLQKLKNNIVKYDFSAPVFIWKTKNGTNYVEDGHQRIRALYALQKEGYKIPKKLPVAYIFAKTRKEAKEKLLGIASGFGKPTVKGLELFIDDADIDLGNTGKDLELPDIKISFPVEIKTKKRKYTCPKCGHRF